ncbi:MAG: hypothetical protein ABW221_16990, partial [Vicinamibacteria bacterium]
MGTTVRARMAATWAAAALAAAVSAQTPQGTSFTYQGRLSEGAVPAGGPYDLRFILYDASVGGSQVGPVVMRDDVAVTAGLFTVGLDFGAVFAGSRRFLEVAVRPGVSTGTYGTLSPRQELTPAPAALFTAAAPWTGLLGKPAGFQDDVDDDALGGLACTTGQVPKWSASGWTCAADANAGGTVTSVAGGTGLTGGTITGAGTLAVAFGGNGSASSAARSDHQHDAAYAPLAHDHNGQTWTGSGNVLTASSTGSVGVTGRSSATTGTGVYGVAGTPTASPLASGVGLRGESTFTQGVGVFAQAMNTDAVGVLSRTSLGVAITGQQTGTGPSSLAAVFGRTASIDGTGVLGIADSLTGGTIGVHGMASSATGRAGQFEGRVTVNGVLEKAAGSFRIDHPLDPEHKYLYHSFVESPDMMNVYNGTVTTDGGGDATVTLPDWFEALNRDFRYQLTAIGQFAQVMVSAKIADNRFSIRTD